MASRLFYFLCLCKKKNSHSYNIKFCKMSLSVSPNVIFFHWLMTPHDVTFFYNLQLICFNSWMSKKFKADPNNGRLVHSLSHLQGRTLFLLESSSSLYLTLSPMLLHTLLTELVTNLYGVKFSIASLFVWSRKWRYTELHLYLNLQYFFSGWK